MIPDTDSPYNVKRVCDTEVTLRQLGRLEGISKRIRYARKRPGGPIEFSPGRQPWVQKALQWARAPAGREKRFRPGNSPWFCRPAGGIGENAPLVREKACAGLAELGYEIDLARNREAVGKVSEISTDSSRIRIMVIPTNEELLIARDTFRVIRNLPIPS